jgi:hypothetical protein
MALWDGRAIQVVKLCLHTEDPADAALSTELAAVSRRTAAQVLQIGSSATADALTGDDAAFWGEGMGYLFSAAIRRCLPKGVPLGEPLAIDTGTNKFEFTAPPGMVGQLPVEQVWIDAAWDSIALVGVVRAALIAMRATPLFVATGPTRTREAQGRFRTFNPLFNVMDDLLRTEAIFLQNEAAWALWNIL